MKTLAEWGRGAVSRERTRCHAHHLGCKRQKSSLLGSLLHTQVRHVAYSNI